MLEIVTKMSTTFLFKFDEDASNVDFGSEMRLTFALTVHYHVPFIITTGAKKLRFTL